jgi:hypothetical protein
MPTSSNANRKLPLDQAFWQWFQEHQDRLFNLEDDQDPILDELEKALGQIHSDLTFEFGPIEHGKREFVISANGIKEAFPAVRLLTAAAPALPQWMIISFRPRRDTIYDVTYGGITISPDDVLFSIQPDHGKVGITLYMRAYNPAEHDTYMDFAYLFLDQTLGEYDMATKVGYVEVAPFEDTNTISKRPLHELPRAFDQLSHLLRN